MFTVIVPTHNRPELLRHTLQSLIDQTYSNFTVIVVDDASSYIPPYAELQPLQGRYVFILRNGIAGPAESRNMGLAISKSKYVLFLDDDDTLEKEHLQSLANHIENSSPELLFCDFKVCHEDRTLSPPQRLSIDRIDISGVTRSSVFVRNRIPNSCLVYRQDVVAAVKHDNQMAIYEDWDFLLECLKGRTLTHVPINSVVIHKSAANAAENMRRGNAHDELIVQTMLDLYKRHPAPDMPTRLERQSLMAGAGIVLAIDYF